MGAYPNRFRGTYLAILSSEVWVLLVDGHSLIDIGLHELVLGIRCRDHAFIASLPGVSDPFDGLCLALKVVSHDLLLTVWSPAGTIVRSVRRLRHVDRLPRQLLHAQWRIRL